jgi:lipopolysaccharide biosynthesis glycosyltransferase
MPDAKIFPENAIHIALTFDDFYWAPAFGTMRSICLTTRRRADLVFHLCHRGLSEAHKADLKAITTEFGARLFYYDIDKNALCASVMKRAPYNRRLTNIVYARLLFDKILPEGIERLVYLDCDMMVRAPIENIAEIDLESFPIAAVAEPYAMGIKHRRDMKLNRDIFDPADPYFNAGLIVIDMKGWRDAMIIEKLEAMLSDGTMARLYYDQDFLNIIFVNNWLKLDQRWNIVDPRWPHQALNPFLLHYTGRHKPWNLWSHVAFASNYRHTMTNKLFYHYWRLRLKKRLLKLIGQ